LKANRSVMSRYNDSMRPGYGGGYGGSYGGGYGSSYSGGYGEDNSADNRYYGNGSGNDDSGAAPSNPPSLRQPSNRTRRAGQYGTNPYGGVGTGGGGYDGPADASSASDTAGARQLPRPTSLERSRAKRRSGGASAGGWGQQRSPTRRRDAEGYGDGSRAVEEVLRQIRADWAFMTDEKCVPVQVALQFMDNSSLGLANRYSRFKQLHAQLQVALKQIVNEQHQGFNSSIGRFHSIQSALQTGQTRLRTLRESLGKTQGSFTTAKPELRGLADASQNYDDMLMTLSAM
jgi:exocyst complex component 4